MATTSCRAPARWGPQRSTQQGHQSTLVDMVESIRALSAQTLQLLQEQDGLLVEPSRDKLVQLSGQVEAALGKLPEQEPAQELHDLLTIIVGLQESQMLLLKQLLMARKQGQGVDAVQSDSEAAVQHQQDVNRAWEAAPRVSAPAHLKQPTVKEQLEAVQRQAETAQRQVKAVQRQVMALQAQRIVTEGLQKALQQSRSTVKGKLEAAKRQLQQLQVLKAALRAIAEQQGVPTQEHVPEPCNRSSSPNLLPQAGQQTLSKLARFLLPQVYDNTMDARHVTWGEIMSNPQIDQFQLQDIIRKYPMLSAGIKRVMTLGDASRLRVLLGADVTYEQLQEQMQHHIRVPQQEQVKQMLQCLADLSNRLQPPEALFV